MFKGEKELVKYKGIWWVLEHVDENVMATLWRNGQKCIAPAENLELMVKNKYFVVYSDSVVIWCWEDEAYQKLASGHWKLYGIAESEEAANIMAEEASY